MLYVLEISERKIKVVYSSVLNNIPEVMEDAVEFLKRVGYSYDSFGLKLAMAEGLTNSVKHGNALNPQLQAVFSLDITTGKMIMNFEDQGEGFDWKEKMEGDFPDETKTSGRGIFLMKEYGFTILYNEVGNKLSLLEI